MSIEFLNVDLDIDSHKDLRPLVDFLGKEVLDLYCGPAMGHQRATLEIATDRSDPDTLIQRFCLLIQSLEGDELDLWDSAFSKVFDIGYSSGLEPSNYRSEIRADTISEVAKIGGSLRISIYPPMEPVHVEEPDA